VWWHLCRQVVVAIVPPPLAAAAERPPLLLPGWVLCSNNSKTLVKESLQQMDLGVLLEKGEGFLPAVLKPLRCHHQ